MFQTARKERRCLRLQLAQRLFLREELADILPRDLRERRVDLVVQRLQPLRARLHLLERPPLPREAVPFLRRMRSVRMSAAAAVCHFPVCLPLPIHFHQIKIPSR